ncbi:GNAT family N-acetyltransferase [Deinococcus radiotolerans]|uniref:GNAT family N-acetyltransferase n=1 Tax=Deinococcus radiotolerans TaxID=1309407 RepID=A0ABQ2FPB2_9DEIO|nr:GNAT family N-acetyltransferase [Deinococcus radiotolerans]GGL13327.1 GNAT family N-acetyltransferase [Deinococcus radiotolerans]
MPSAADLARGAPVVVRARRPADLSTLVQVLRDVHGAVGYPSVWPDDPAAFVAGPGGETAEAWVAERAGQVVGQVLLAPLPDPHPDWAVRADLPAGTLEVKRLFVYPGAQRSGAARALLTHVLREVQARDVGAALQVNEHSAPAVRLYERGGWRFRTRTRAAWTDPDGTHPWVRVYTSPGT